MKNQNKVLACVDQSRFADYVADYAAWAACRMDAPLEFLHIIAPSLEQQSQADRSGSIGINEQEELLAKLSNEDETRARSAREQGRIFLNRLRVRATTMGTTWVDIRQRHGELEETLVEQAEGVRLLVLGRRGESADIEQRSLGRNVERVVRALNRPILAISEEFHEPQRIMIAFDGGNATRRGVEMIASNPLFKGLLITLLMVGEVRKDAQKQLHWAKTVLDAVGFKVTTLCMSGDTKTVIAAAVKEQSIDMLIMGAFGHTPLHRLLFGSKTADLLRSSHIPTLLLR